MTSIKTLAFAVLAASTVASCATVERYNPFKKDKEAAAPAAAETASASAACDAQRATVDSTLSTPEQRDAARSAMIAAGCTNVPQ